MCDTAVNITMPTRASEMENIIFFLEGYSIILFSFLKLRTLRYKNPKTDTAGDSLKQRGTTQSTLL